MILGLIPSRLNSKRLKEKPLLEIDGLPIIIHSMKRAELSKKLDDVIVCTDDKKIVDVSWCLHTDSNRKPTDYKSVIAKAFS